MLSFSSLPAWLRSAAIPCTLIVGIRRRQLYVNLRILQGTQIRTAKAADKAVLMSVVTVSLRVFLVWEIAAVTHQAKGLDGWRDLCNAREWCWVRKEGNLLCISSNVQKAAKYQYRNATCISCTSLHTWLIDLQFNTSDKKNTFFKKNLLIYRK